MTTPGNDLTPAEQKLIEAARQGLEVFYGDSPEEERLLRGTVVAALAAGWRKDWEVHPRGIRARDAHIKGYIDLTGAEVKQAISLERCQLDDPLVLTDASTRTVSLRGCKVRLFQAERVAIKGLLDLREVKTSDTIFLADARVGGSLELRGAELIGQVAVALDASRSRIEGNIDLQQIECRGEILLPGAEIRGSLLAVQSTLHAEGKPINSEGLRIDGSISLEKAKIFGEIFLSYAQIGGSLNLDGSSLSNDEKNALSAIGIDVKGDLHIYQAEVLGSIELDGARIGGLLFAEESRLINGAGSAITAIGAKVEIAFVVHKCEIHGKLNLFRGDLGMLEISDSLLQASFKALALGAISLKVHGRIILRNSTVKGEIDLLDGKLGGLEIIKCALEPPGKTSLNANNLSVSGLVLLQNNVIHREVWFVGADIQGDLDLSESHFSGRLGLAYARIRGSLDCKGIALLTDGDRALDARGMSVGGVLHWWKLSKPLSGSVVFVGASVGQLDDNEDSWWPETMLDGFTYGSFSHHAPGGLARLRWLRQAEFSPQAYEQAAQVLRRMGHEGDARRILRAKQDDLRDRGRLTRVARIWNRLLGATLGHGYQVWRSALLLLALITIGTLVFHVAYTNGFLSTTDVGAKTESLPPFQPLAYSLDVGLPIIDLHQERNWLPRGHTVSDRPFRYYFWAHIAFGWLFTSLLVTGLAGLVKKE